MACELKGSWIQSRRDEGGGKVRGRGNRTRLALFYLSMNISCIFFVRTARAFRLWCAEWWWWWVRPAANLPANPILGYGRGPAGREVA